MPDKPWKQFERTVAKIFGGRRYPANQGGKVDVENEDWVVQCKNTRTLSQAQLEHLVEEITGIAAERGKLGLVVTKRRAGSGVETLEVAHLTLETLQQLSVRDRSGDV